MKHKTQITLATQNLEAPSFRLRLRVLEPYLAANGWSVQALEIPRRPEWLRILLKLRQLQGSDVVVISKFKLLAGERQLVRRWTGGFVYDVDDAVMYARPRTPGKPIQRACWRRRRFTHMTTSAASVVVASQHLAEMLEMTSGPVTVLPTPVDVERFPAAIHKERTQVTVLGWIGLGSNLPYLESLAPAFRALSQAGIAYELRVISDRAPRLDGVPWRLVRWSPESEGRALAELHIGLAPMPDDPWARGKGGYRCIQYAAAGLPSVVSPVGANREVVVDCETGHWASSFDDWVHRLRELCGNIPLRRYLGAAARTRARRLYSVERFAAQYCGVLSQILEQAEQSGRLPIREEPSNQVGSQPAYGPCRAEGYDRIETNRRIGARRAAPYP